MSTPTEIARQLHSDRPWEALESLVSEIEELFYFKTFGNEHKLAHKKQETVRLLIEMRTGPNRAVDEAKFWKGEHTEEGGQP